MKRIRIPAFAGLAMLLALVSCGKDGPEGIRPDRYRHVFIGYLAGYNNLSQYLRSNLEALGSGVLPEKSRDQAIVIFAHNTVSAGDYSTPSAPCLLQLYRDRGACAIDTLATYPATLSSTDGQTLRLALEDVMELFPSDSYGMLFSSHATGWIPEGYRASSSGTFSAGEEWQEPPLPTKSIGAQYHGSSSVSEEMELQEFAEAIPMKLDYIIFDACLMGGVEVAWELRDACGTVAFSPAEIIANGFVYEPMSWRLFSGATPDIEGICRDYFEHYDSLEGDWRSATITVVDCGSLDALAHCMEGIIENHRNAVPQAREVCQRYFYDRKQYYFDLRDFAVCMGASAYELEELDAALEQCISYHAETPTFFNLELERCCGLSTYIPSEALPELNSFYRTLSWNEAVGLVE